MFQEIKIKGNLTVLSALIGWIFFDDFTVQNVAAGDGFDGWLWVRSWFLFTPYTVASFKAYFVGWRGSITQLLLVTQLTIMLLETFSIIQFCRDVPLLLRLWTTRFVLLSIVYIITNPSYGKFVVLVSSMNSGACPSDYAGVSCWMVTEGLQ